MPNEFVDEQEMGGFVNLVESATEYLDSLISDKNCNDPLAWAVQGYVINVRESLNQLHKKRADEARGHRQRTAKKKVPAPLLLVPTMVEGRF